MPTSRSPSFVNATTDGVVRAPSEFSMTRGFAPSITDTHEFVVPKSMPITSPFGAASAYDATRVCRRLSGQPLTLPPPSSFFLSLTFKINVRRMP
jgi:hypothetical protein